MTKSITRMRFLFQDKEFKARLLDLAKGGKLVAGAPCPTEDCDGGVLKEANISYMSMDFVLQSVNILQCKCGFQFRLNEDDK